MLVMLAACASNGSTLAAVTPATTTAPPTTGSAPPTTGTPPTGSPASTTAAPAPATTGPTGAPTSTAAPSAPPSATSSATSGGLEVTLTATPSRVAPGAPVQFSLSAREAQARGALGYQISYGDGTSDQIAVPLVCLGGAGSVRAQAWPLTHRYAGAGVFRVSATVTATCTSDHATAVVSLTVT